MDEPRKINPDAIEVVGVGGSSSQIKVGPKMGRKMSQIKVISGGGPWLLLILPLFLPVLLFALFFLAVLALFFGKSVFSIATKGVRKL